jgi:hypothetical protein
MALIGEFEAAVREADPTREPDTFKLEGHTFTVSDEPNLVALGMFAREARAGVDSNDMEGLAVLIDTIASLVVPEDEERFLSLASRRRVKPDLLMKIMNAVMEAQAGRPIEPSTDSSAGRLETGVSWKAPSSSAESSAPKTWRDTPFGRRELAAHPELYEDFGTVADNGRNLSSVD